MVQIQTIKKLVEQVEQQQKTIDELSKRITTLELKHANRRANRTNSRS